MDSVIFVSSYICDTICYPHRLPLSTVPSAKKRGDISNYNYCNYKISLGTVANSNENGSFVPGTERGTVGTRVLSDRFRGWQLICQRYCLFAGRWDSNPCSVPADLKPESLWCLFWQVCMNEAAGLRQLSILQVSVRFCVERQMMMTGKGHFITAFPASASYFCNPRLKAGRIQYGHFWTKFFKHVLL